MNGDVKSNMGDFEISAIVTKADGTVIDLGVIAKTKENIFAKLIRRFKTWLM
jgi:myo-inositol-hexaphosphate 3-phosphohydrolase